MTLELNAGPNGLELHHDAGNWVLKREFGYSPVQMLVAAIGSCGGYVYESILEKSSIPGTLQRVLISYTVDESKKTKSLKTVTIAFEMTLEESFRDRAERSLRLVNEYCPVIQSLDPTIVIEKTVSFI